VIAEDEKMVSDVMSTRPVLYLGVSRANPQGASRSRLLSAWKPFWQARRGAFGLMGELVGWKAESKIAIIPGEIS